MNQTEIRKQPKNKHGRRTHVHLTGWDMTSNSTHHKPILLDRSLRFFMMFFARSRESRKKKRKIKNRNRYLKKKNERKTQERKSQGHMRSCHSALPENAQLTILGYWKLLLRLQTNKRRQTIWTPMNQTTNTYLQTGNHTAKQQVAIKKKVHTNRRHKPTRQPHTPMNQTVTH